MIRRIPVPRTPLQVVVVLAAGLVLVAATVEGFDALVGGDEPSPAAGTDTAAEEAVPQPDPEVRIEGDNEIVIDFGGHDQTRVRIGGTEADLAELERCLDEGLRRIVEEERAAGHPGNRGWVAHFASKRRMKSRFREIEQQCMTGQIAPFMLEALRPSVPPPASEAPGNGDRAAPAKPDGS